MIITFELKIDADVDSFAEEDVIPIEYIMTTLQSNLDYDNFNSTIEDIKIISME